MGTHQGLREPSCVIAWGLDERPWPICLICLSLWPFHHGSNLRLPELPMDTGKMCSVQRSWKQKAGPCLRTPVTFWAYVKCPESRPSGLREAQASWRRSQLICGQCIQLFRALATMAVNALRYGISTEGIWAGAQALGRSTLKTCLWGLSRGRSGCAAESGHRGEAGRSWAGRPRGEVKGTGSGTLCAGTYHSIPG